MPDTKRVFDGTYEDLSKILMSAEPGSFANKQHLQLINFRLVKDGIAALDRTAASIVQAGDQLSAVIETSNERAQASTERVEKLNVRLVQLTWVLVILTLVMVFVGAVQLIVMFDEKPQSDGNPSSVIGSDLQK